MTIIELHKNLWRELDARRSRLPHALLFSGQRGIGKYQLAMYFAKSLLCENPSAENAPCETCLACGWMRDGNHPDFRLLEPDVFAEEEVVADADKAKKAASVQIKIEQVRALDEFLHVGTHRQGRRVILIHPAEAMNRATANSLLKSLEEPIENTVFLLVSSEYQRLLPTIRSRCQRIPVALPETAASEAWLAEAGIKNAANHLALAGGSPLLAAELASKEESELVELLLKHWKDGERTNPLTAAAEIERLIKADKRSFSLKKIIDWTQKWLLDLAQAKTGKLPRYFLQETAVFKRLEPLTTLSRLLAFERHAIEYKRYCEQPLNNRLFLEKFFIDYKTLFRLSK